MRMNTIAPLVMAALACLTVSCQKIQEPALIEANLKFTTAQFTDAIPAAYGQLVSVTPTSDAYGAVLWFRKPDESIVVMKINYARGALSPNILEIPRR